MNFVDRIKVVSNVTILKKAADGTVVDRRDSHNVLINNGRKWFRNTVACATYAGVVHGAGINLAGSATGDEQDDFALYGKTYRPRYIGLGTGGVLQSIGPKGAQVEEVSIVTLESPLLVSADVWLQQLLEQDDVSDPETFPTDFSIRFRTQIGLTDVSFPEQVDAWGTDVPISEVGLFTSEVDRAVTPDGTGMIAYNIFSPISKTPNFALEVAWELRF